MAPAWANVARGSRLTERRRGPPGRVPLGHGALWFALPCSPERAWMSLAGGIRQPRRRRESVNQMSQAAQRTEGAAVVRTASELAALGHMTGVELAEKYLALFGQAARSRNK